MTEHPLESLSAFLDDELPDAERRLVQAHLAGCPACARHLRELEALDALAHGLPAIAAPEGYVEALPGRVRERIRAHRPVARRATWVLPLAAGIALAVLSPLVLRHRSAPDLAPEARTPLAVEQPAAPAPPAAAPETRAKTTAEERVDSAGARDMGAVTPPPRALARARAPRLESAAAPPTRDAFVPPPAAPLAAAGANESDRAAAGGVAAEGAAADAFADAPQHVTASRDERGSPAAAGRLEEQAAPPSLKKADASRQGATAPREKEEKAFRENAARPASTVEEARAAREAWRQFLSEHQSGPRADEGRVRFIAAAAEVFRLSRDDGDRALAEREARAYLARPDAAQAARVREVLRLLER